MKWWPVTDPAWLLAFPLGMFLSFLVMRLLHVTNWQWWVVSSPLWGAVVLLGLCIAFFGTIYAMAWKD